MGQLSNESRVTFGCVMAKVRDNESEKNKENLQDEVGFSFCYTSDNGSNGLTSTLEMRELTNSGFFLVAVTQFDVDDPKKLYVWLLRRISDRIRSAFANTALDLVHNALSDLVVNQGRGAGKMC
jgi:hypothetical protein